LPVIVTEYDALHDILPDKLSEVFSNNNVDIDFDQLYRLAETSDLMPRIRLIPFSSLGKQNGMLIGIKPDTIKINTRKYTRKITKVIIGISKNKVSNDGEYNALFSPEILK
jgi:stage II sporulation protein GA (sporulation sigma-E factor processing peptidase)